MRGARWDEPAGVPVRKWRLKIADLDYYEGFEGSIKLSELLYRHGKICSTSGCSQQKTQNSNLCFTCQKVNSGLVTLNPKEAYNEDYE